MPAEFVGIRRIQPGDRALSLRQAEYLYGIPIHWLRQMRADRTLDFFKFGSRLFVSERSLIAFLERHRVPAITTGAEITA